MAQASHDSNRNTTLLAVDDTLLTTPTLVKAFAASNSLAVAIVDGSGNQITSFGGGTQYIDAAVPPAHPTGTAIEWSDGSNWQTVSTAKPLPVSGSFSLTNPSTGSAVPATANYIAANKAGNLTGLLIGSQTTANSLAVALASDQVSIPVTGTFWQATQPISAASLPLPSGAATAAKQPALGTAGSASSDVITVQGIAAMTALKVDGSGATQPVSGTVTVTQSTASSLKVDLSGTAANATAIKVDNSAFTQPVSGTVTANQGGTWTVQPGNTANSTAWLTTDSATSATGSAVPSKASYKGLNPITTLPSAATAGNLVGATADKFGRQVVLPVTIRDLVGTQTTTISASTSETTIVTAGGAGIFNDLTLVLVSNTSATAARVDFRDTTAGSVLFSLYVPAGDARGFSMGGVPIPQTSANTNWTAQSSASVTDLRVYAVFAKNK